MLLKRFLVALIFAAGLVSSAAAQQDSVSLSFTVYDQDSGAPVPGAIVYFHPYATYTVTDADGFASFDTHTEQYGYWPKGASFDVSVYEASYPLLTRAFVTPDCSTCTSYTVAAYMIELGKASFASKLIESEVPQEPTTDPAQGPYAFPPAGCGSYEWRVKTTEDLPCSDPNGAELACVTYINGTPTGTGEVDDEASSETEVSAELSSSAEAKLGTFGAKVSAKVGGKKKVTKKVKIKTTIGGTDLAGKCGEVCVRTKIKKITLQRWKYVCWRDEAGWWGAWAPTGNEQEFEMVTGYCHDTSALVDC